MKPKKQANVFELTLFSLPNLFLSFAEDKRAK